MNFYIFRHGETQESKNHTSYSTRIETSAILPEGIPTIKRLARYLKKISPDGNYSSPYLRCRQTVEIIEQITKTDFISDKRISEFRRDKEDLDSMIYRITNFYEDIKRKNLNNIAICTHGYPVASLVLLITKGNVDKNDINNYPNPGVLIEIKEKKTNYLDFNKK